MEEPDGEATAATTLQRIDYNDGIAFGAVYGEVNISSHTRSSLRQRFLQSLAFLGMNARANHITKTPGTCDWIVQHSTFGAWAESPTGMLWIRGGPGTGKSTLLHHVLQYMRATSDQSVSLQFFANAQGSPLDHSVEGAWRCLLHQAVNTGLPRLESEMQEFETRCEVYGEPGSKWQWYEDEVRTMLCTALEEICDHVPVNLFLDGLDEAGEADATRMIALLHELTDKITSARRKNPLKVCFSCRRFPLFDHRADYHIETEDGNSLDITLTIALEVNKRFPPVWQEPLRLALEEKSKNSYQWVILSLRQIDRLRAKGRNLGHILEEISSLPLGIESLYNDVLEQLDPCQLDLSVKIFQWTLFSIRPLSLRELWLATHLDIESATQVPNITLEEDVQIQVQDFDSRIVDLTGGLFRKTKTHIQLDRVSWGLEPIHQSVVDYMKASGFKKLATRLGAPLAIDHEFFISRSLITYILHLQRLTGWSSRFLALFRDSSSRTTISAFALCKYASYHWADHLRNAELQHITSKDIAHISTENLSNISLLQTYTKAHHWGFPQNEPWILNLLLLCVCSGLCDLLLHLRHLVPQRPRQRRLSLKSSPGRLEPLIDTPSSNGKTLLCTAIIERQYTAARILLEDYDADPDAPTANKTGAPWKPRMSALLLAIADSKLDMVSQLLKAGADPNLSDGTFTPLNFAIAHEDEHVVNILVKRGARFSRNKSEKSLFYALAMRRFKGVIDLLERGSDPTAKLSFLSWEAIYLLEVAHLLHEDEQSQFFKINELISPFDANEPLANDLSPLACALQQSNMFGASAFIRAGASINGSKHSGIPAFVQAVYYGPPHVIDECSRLGAQWDLKGQSSPTYVFTTLQNRLGWTSEEDCREALDVIEHMYSIDAITEAERNELMTSAHSPDFNSFQPIKEPYWDNWKRFIEL